MKHVKYLLIGIPLVIVVLAGLIGCISGIIWVCEWSAVHLGMDKKDAVLLLLPIPALMAIFMFIYLAWDAGRMIIDEERE